MISFLIIETIVMSYCAYCDGMIPAFPHANYCSYRSNSSEKIHSNAYFFKSQGQYSGKHKSRYSIRLLSKGYQQYIVDNKKFSLQPNNFLFVRDGSTFENNTEKFDRTEGLVIAFNQYFINHYLFSKIRTQENQLENPFSHENVQLNFDENTYLKTPIVTQLSQHILIGIINGIRSPFYYQYYFMLILDEILHIETGIIDGDQPSAIKSTTREELYRRLRKSMEYMDGNLSHHLTLNQIARNSLLSPFHFLRSFTNYYGVTPYQYLLQERLRKAHYYIENRITDIEEIMLRTGFENKRTFQRAFMHKYAITPFQLILKNN